MIRTLLLASSLALLTASSAGAREPAAKDAAAQAKDARTKAKIAKAPKKAKKGADKAVEKPVAPEGGRVDPRASAPEPSPPTAVGGRGMSRIEFDDRLVQGQTNKANAIYLFERRESALRSLLKKRTDFHEEIDETLE